MLLPGVSPAWVVEAPPGVGPLPTFPSSVLAFAELPVYAMGEKGCWKGGREPLSAPA